MDGFDIGQSLEDGLSTIINFIPNLLGALLILLIGYFVAKGIGKLVTKALHKIRFDRAMHTSQAGNYISRVVESPSRFTGSATYWLVFLLFVSFAVSALNLDLLNQILAGIYSYIPRVIAAIVIFLVASAISAGSAAFVTRIMGRTATAKLITTVIPTITMSIAVFMILNELNIARDIVNILFTAIVGAAALGLALAFGLGGRDVARQLLEQVADSARENADVAQGDVRRAASNAKRQAREARENLNN